MRARLAIVFALCLAFVRLPAQTAWLGGAQSIAPGIDYFTSTDRTLVDGAGPIALYVLKLDPSRVRLTDTLARGEVLGFDTAVNIAARHNAVAAINGGFFNRTNGEPVGVLKIGNELVSDYSIVRGVVLIKSPASEPTTLEFEQLSVRMTLSFVVGTRTWRVPIDGVDTTRERGKVMLYTPRYHADTDTAPNGTEWTLDGTPLHVTGMRRGQGHTMIPKYGAVLSYGGTDPPPALAALKIDTRVALETSWTTLNGMTPAHLDQAESIVNGAGLLRLHGKTMTNWERGEGLDPAAFINMRHPRTLIGVDPAGDIWMAAIDGRQPDYSIGMTLPDLVRLALRLNLQDALNLDGGGSTTMVVKGRIVNKPSDPTGPRQINDAILVNER
jgi:Phosphodiester glycosidase